MLTALAGTNYPMWYPFADEDHSQQYRVDLQLLQLQPVASELGVQDEAGAQSGIAEWQS